MDETQWRTHRLELDDQTLREWDAAVLAADAEGIVLDGRRSTPAAAASRPITAYCCGVACKPASSARARVTTCT